MASLRKSHIAAIYRDIGAGADALQHKIDTAPCASQNKFSLIYTAGVIVRQIGWITGVGIVYVAVIRMIISL